MNEKKSTNIKGRAVKWNIVKNGTMFYKYGVYY